MSRIRGVDLPKEKRVEVGLTYIYGIGINKSRKILIDTNISFDTRVKDLTDSEIKKISDYIDKNCIVEGSLKSEIAFNIKRLKEIKCYKGIRHRKNLPVRGQKTRTNARTCKNRKSK